MTAPPTRSSTFSTIALAALADLDLGDDVSPVTRPLAEARDEVGRDWLSQAELALARPRPRDRGLADLARDLVLHPLEALAVALAAVVEEDVRVGRLIAHLQAPLGGSRPTVGLLTTAFAGVISASELTALLSYGAAASCGLLTLSEDGSPLAEQTLSVPLHLVFALAGREAPIPGASFESSPVALSPSLREASRRYARTLGDGRSLLVRSHSPAEGRALASAIAVTLERRPVFLPDAETPGLGPWLTSRRLMPIFRFELAPGERAQLPRLAGYRGPIVALSGVDGSVESATGRVLAYSIPVPPPAERLRLWRRALDQGAVPILEVGEETSADPTEETEEAQEPQEAGGAAIDAITGGHWCEKLAVEQRHSAGRIAHLASLARQLATLDGRAHILPEDIEKASWVGEGAGLDALAEPLSDRVGEGALILPDSVRRDLETLMLRCRHRDGLTSGLGSSARARYRPGVKALFLGPSGTGKTLATIWLASRLALPLYRVDLAAVTSKYVGETEKNLAQVLERAEAAGAVLLFDEADSIFGKRTDIKDSNDRFANTQTNYLLQRIETFDGIAILTSNSRSRFDSAFTRRLDLMVEFALPGPADRRRLWRSHLGQTDALTARDINRLAATVDLAGGHVRNAVLAAAVWAESEGRGVEWDDLLRGLESEYRKLGRQMPPDLCV